MPGLRKTTGFRVWIADRALRSMAEEATRTRHSETGGVLVGYRVEDTFVIREVIGPGPSALHSPARFEPDAHWQYAELDRLYASSGGVLRYLGDWHTHPDGSPQMSTLDRRTLASIAACRHTKEPNPLMLIGGGGNDAWAWRVHIYTGRTIARKAKTVCSEVIEFATEEPTAAYGRQTVPSWTSDSSASLGLQLSRPCASSRPATPPADTLREDTPSEITGSAS